jgi:predicted AlkP superfamily pyrophosphatase or phosphodiesterase
MSNKVVVIVLDALRYDVACSHLGFMQHLIEQKKAARYEVIGELPSLSRPMYETICTGLPAIEHGILHNTMSQLSKEESIFHLATGQGKTTAAAAYFWVSELYNRAPFNPFTDRLQFNQLTPIENGIFYFEDHYPDSHLFTDAHHLLTTYMPDLLYVHPMNIDNDGHIATANSALYRNRVLMVDGLLALTIPQWQALGYDIIVTADHGMTDDGAHGGTTFADRHVPLFILSEKIAAGIYDEPISQLQMAPLICHLLNIRPSNKMQKLAITGLKERDYNENE